MQNFQIVISFDPCEIIANPESPANMLRVVRVFTTYLNEAEVEEVPIIKTVNYTGLDGSGEEETYTVHYQASHNLDPGAE